jgi:uncharacterized membrane protein
MKIKYDVKWEMLIFWIVFTLFFIVLVQNAHFLTNEQSIIAFVVGMGLIIIGFVKTGL